MQELFLFGVVAGMGEVAEVDAVLTELDLGNVGASSSGTTTRVAKTKRRGTGDARPCKYDLAPDARQVMHKSHLSSNLAQGNRPG